MTTPPASIPLDTPDDVRAFLRACLHRDGRTPNTPRSLHLVMPEWLRTALHAHAPHLATLLADANRLHNAENAAHDTYARALAEWIEDAPTPEQPAPTAVVAVTRYTVSVFPAGDRDRRHYALHVEQKPRGWIVTDGATYYGPDGSEELSQSTAHHFADYDDALALARELAPGLTINGHTAADVYNRTRNA
ncbi:hypothetical protein [Streptomyces sp. NPDC056683]|uniref:hypothetical protein n=1 Tax=Streptomyces sp. NPDC056683 TaxID=3345910 RepID=UPI0036A0DB08